MKTYDYIIGIDPGTHTGFSIWRTDYKYIESVMTTKIHIAMDEVKAYRDTGLTFVRIEDARLRTWYGDDKGNRAKSQGVGSIKRDCTIWEDFCKDCGIDYEMVKPGAVRTKLTAEAFKNLTGWQGRTTEHSRDAALLCFKYQ
jgi:hypothetical protein